MESCFILKFIWRNRILGLCMWKPQERKGPDDHGPIPCSAIYVISSLKNLLIFLAIFFTCKKKWLFCYMFPRRHEDKEISSREGNLKYLNNVKCSNSHSSKHVKLGDAFRYKYFRYANCWNHPYSHKVQSLDGHLSIN